MLLYRTYVERRLNNRYANDCSKNKQEPIWLIITKSLWYYVLKLYMRPAVKKSFIAYIDKWTIIARHQNEKYAPTPKPTVISRSWGSGEVVYSEESHLLKLYLTRTVLR